MTPHKLPIAAVTFSLIFWFSLYFGLYFAGWPGDPHPCANPPYCFCETVFAGDLAAQKSNTWSDLGFVLAAIVIAWHGSRLLSRNTQLTSEQATFKPFYANSPLLISIYASAILYMGPGSMFFHGSMKQWGGWLDVISMYVFVNYVITYLVYRTWALSLKTFVLLYFVLCSSAVLLSIFLHDLSSQVFPLFAAILISLALLQSVPITKIKLGREKNLNFDAKWLVFSIGFFVSAVIIWRLSDSGMALCYPDSLLQGHAAWHILSACMTVCIHFYFLSEKSLSEKGFSKENLNK